MLCLIGAINFLEGLIAIVRDEYYVVGGKQVILFDLTTWGWIMLFWGHRPLRRRRRSRRGQRVGALVRGCRRQPQPAGAARVPRQHAVSAVVARRDRDRDRNHLCADGTLVGSQDRRIATAHPNRMTLSRLTPG
jgi:hypothetical protein